MELIRSLKDICPDDVTGAGGKGANLGALVQAGLPIPPGFVVLSSAYLLFVEVNDIQKEIRQLAGKFSLTDPALSEQISTAIRSLFDRGKMPEEITEAVLDAYTQLGEPAVAVRSSATAEDLPGASFAGQQESYLNILTSGKLLEAVKRCWSSLWTSRAIDYRMRQRINPGSVNMAVIVQKMVQASASGVLFTVNPVNGARDEVVINASWGLGEAIVSGRVSPDVIVVDKESGQVKHVQVAEKLLMSVPADSGVVEQAVPSGLRQQTVLSAGQIVQLLSLGRRIESHFQSAQDIEWAIVDDQVFVLQARPVTALTGTISSRGEPVPPGDDTWNREKDLPPQPFDLWTRTNVGENLPFPVSPLTETNFLALFKLGDDTPKQGAVPVQAMRRLYGRMYLNEGAIVHSLTEEYGLPSSFMDRMWGSRRRGKQQVSAKFRPLRLLRKLPSLLSMGFNASKSKGPRHTPEQFFAQINQWVENFMQQDLSLLDDRSLWAEGFPVWRDRGEYAFATNLRISAPSAVVYAVLERIVKWWTGQKELAQVLITGPGGVYSAEVGPDLWRMAQSVQEAGLKYVLLDNTPLEALRLLCCLSEAQPLIKQLEHFLARHGHRCPNELELLNPRWAEAPEQVIELVTHYLQADENIDPVAAEARQRQHCTEATASVEVRLDPLRRAIFRSVLKRAHRAVTVRDNSRYYMAKFIFPMRKLYAEFGWRWAVRSWLNQADDVFFLTVSEIQNIIEDGPSSVSPGELQTRIANRRLAYEYWFSVVAPDAIGPDGASIIEEEEDLKILKGVSASSGRVSGRARVVQDVHEAMQLTHGDILIMQATDPGWTPVFPLVSGIVLEIGGQLSHGAIIAREYGVPAVINVPGAMRNIKDGQIIVVDGTNGRVYLEDRL